MLHNRKVGILALYGACVSLGLPLWFMAYYFAYSLLGSGLVWEGAKLELYTASLLLGTLSYFGHYHRLGYRRHGGRLLSAVQVAAFQTLIAALVLFGVAFVVHSLALSRIFVLSFLALSWVGFILSNYFGPSWVARVALWHDAPLRTILIGSSKAAAHLWGWLEGQKDIGVNTIGLVTEEEADKGLIGLPHLGKAWELEEVLKTNSIDQVILLEGMTSTERSRNIFRLCQRKGVRILIYSYWEDLLNYPLCPISEGEATFFTLGEEPLENIVNRLLKRTFDIIVSAAVCALVLPLLLLWVMSRQKKESPGPLFFKQLRAGKNGRPFEVLKIRTMHVRTNDAADVRQATQGDERVYPFGEWLRKTSLDELPQFINVLRGQMSVVGPRPHMLAHDAKFAEFVDVYRSRFFVKPGITGLAQVNGYRGEIENAEQLEKRIKYDIEYITSWSFWLDVVIVLKTAWFVLRPQKKAY